MRRLLTGFTAVVVLSGVFAASQMIDLSAPAPKPKQFISYTAEEQVVKAGKKSWVEMHFHVIDGYHVNSHTPLTELQIPTVLKLDAADGIKFESVQYPAGAAYVIEDGTKLDVYSGMFAVRIPVVASAGMHTVNGTLRYQACDGGSCFPPRNLPVQLLLTAK
ncbi:MAG: protein-disulfide reductase DsbD N-terminal domain-containing protein [Acidobacteriaceae bacterium]|nr:protein-disulfide reductase DsbD N-terminal domain-containing protein [Acidobacteriaceae bacterium]